MHCSLNNNDTFCLYNFIKVPDKCCDFRLELVDEFTKIVPNNFESFIGHHQELLGCRRNVF